MLDPTLRYDKLKAPFIGHALDELLTERNSKYSWSGSYSFNGQEEYETFKFYDNSVSEAGREIDPRTGGPKNQRSYSQVSSELPTLEEIIARHNELLDEYAAYEGKRNRNYPPIAEQIDMLYKDIAAGTLGESAQESTFYKTIKEIKESNS